MELARVRAKELSESFSHTRPNGDPGTMIIWDYYPYIYDWYHGENIGMTNGDYAYMFQLFEESDGHRGTMIASKYTMMGIGCYIDYNETYGINVMYCCQLFAGPWE